MHARAFAVIADVHGNAWALEAVLADIAARGIRTIVNLGDNANGPLDPVRAVALLRASRAIHVRGNGDRMTGDGSEPMPGSVRYARERLDADALRWLRELPVQARGDGWLAFHATPRSDSEYLLENPVAGSVIPASAHEIATRLGDADAPLLLCGHTHLARLVQLPDGRLVVNPGSVGLPAYTDDVPVPHAVEAGSPDARYACVERAGDRWRVEFVCLPYDAHAAANAARAAGWHDWARHVETGFR